MPKIYILDTSDARNIVVKNELKKLNLEAHSFPYEESNPDIELIYVLSPTFKFASSNLDFFRVGSTLFYYNLSDDFKEILLRKNITLISFSSVESYTYYNCLLTAEGALMHAIAMTDIALRESKVLILGYGHLGKALLKVFSGLSYNITICARKTKDRAEAEVFGAIAIDINEAKRNLKDYTIIINTIPFNIFGGDCVFNNDVAILELASKVYPFDYDELKMNNINYAILGALPSKTARVSAGKLVLNTILNY